MIHLRGVVREYLKRHLAGGIGKRHRVGVMTVYEHEPFP